MVLQPKPLSVRAALVLLVIGGILGLIRIGFAIYAACHSPHYPGGFVSFLFALLPLCAIALYGSVIYFLSRASQLARFLFLGLVLISTVMSLSHLLDFLLSPHAKMGLNPMQFIFGLVGVCLLWATTILLFLPTSNNWYMQHFLANRIVGSAGRLLELFDFNGRTNGRAASRSGKNVPALAHGRQDKRKSS